VPGWRFEPGFTETDLLWSGKYAESGSAQAARSRIALDQIFGEDAATWISITSHSGEIATLLTVLGHRAFSLATGQAIPVLVRAERAYQAYPTATIQAWASQATCTQPPITSLADTGCVCPTATAAVTQK
jgi:hypothetical protein